MYKRMFSLVLICVMCITLSGCGVFETLSSFSKGQPTSFSDVNDLESGKAYVWHHEGDPIILYDENGSVIYDPSDPDGYVEEPVYDDADEGVPEDELEMEGSE